MTVYNSIENDPSLWGPGILVFVPELLENAGEFARRVFDQAAAENRWVLYLAADGHENNSLAAARQLATLTALTQGSSVHASGLQVDTDNWTDALRKLAHPGDLVIWPEAGLLAPTSLENELGITQLVMSAVRTSSPKVRSGFRQLAFWAIVLAALFGFGYLEMTFKNQLTGFPAYAGVSLLFALEIAFLYWLDGVFR